MKNFKKLTLFSVFAAPSIISSACTLDQATVTNALYDFEWIIPSAGQINYNQNLTFWSLIATKVSEQNTIDDEDFVSILNTSGIFRSPVNKLPSNTTIELIDPKSKFSLSNNSDSLQFKLKGRNFTKRFEAKWTVSFSQEQYLDVLISTIPNFDFETTVADHNRLVRFVSEHPNRDWEVDSEIAIKLISVILDLDTYGSNSNFFAENILVTKLTYSKDFLKYLEPNNSDEFSAFNLSIEISHIENEIVNRRNVSFSWQIKELYLSAIYDWVHSPRLNVNLKNFNDIVSSVNNLRNSNDYAQQKLSANSVIDIINVYIPNNELNRFDEDIKVISIIEMSSLISSSSQETMRLVIADRSKGETRTRNIKIDFLVHATSDDLLNSWNLPSNFQDISLENLKYLSDQLSVLDQNDVQSASRIFWSLISNSLRSKRLSSFPPGVKVLFDTDQLVWVNNLISGDIFSFTFSLVIGNQSRKFVLNYRLKITQTEEIDNLNYSFIYNLSKPEFNSLKVGLEDLQLRTDGENLTKTFRRLLPSDFSKPKFPTFALLSSKIKVDTSNLPVVDLKVNLTSNDSDTGIEVMVARIFVAESSQVSLDNIELDDTIPIIEKPILDQLKTEIDANIRYNKSSVNELYHYLKFWLPATNLPSKSFIKNLTWPRNFSNGQVSHINFEVGLGNAHKTFSHSFIYYDSLYASGVKWKNPSNINISSAKYIQFSDQINSLRPHGSLFASILNEPLIELFEDSSQYTQISSNLGLIHSLAPLPVYNGTQKFITFEFSVKRGQVLETYSLLLTIEDSIEQSLISWDLMRPKELTFDAIDYNRWYEKYRQKRFFSGYEADSFLAHTYLNAGLVGSLALPPQAKILDWFLSEENYVFSSKNLILNLQINVGNRTKNFVFKISVVANPLTTIKSYFSVVSGSLRKMQLNSRQYNSFIETINNPNYQSANFFVQQFNNFSNSQQIPYFDSEVEYKVITQLNYQAIDQPGSFSFMVQFRYANELSSEFKVVFTGQISPDYDFVLQEFEESFLLHQTDIEFSYADFKRFSYLFNDAILTRDKYLRALKVVSVLSKFNLLRNAPIYLSGIEITSTPILIDSGYNSSYQLKINYDAPGFNLRVLEFELKIVKDFEQEVVDLQYTLQDKDITYNNFVTFANKWNTYGSQITDNRVGLLLNQTFDGVFNLNKFEIFKVSNIDFSSFLNLTDDKINSKIYTIAIEISKFSSERKIIYLTFLIDIDDDAVVNNGNIANYSLSGTQKRFKDLYNFVNENDYRGSSGKNSLLNEIARLFKSHLNLQLADFNFRKITFAGSWSQVNVITSQNYLLVEYGYRNSKNTKTFKILVNIAHSVDNVREDLANVTTSELNYRSFLTFDEGILKAKSLAEVDQIIYQHSSSTSLPNFVDNWGSSLILISVLKLDELTDFSSGSFQKYLIVLSWKKDNLQFDLSTLLSVPVRYDLDDQTSQWIAKNFSTSFNSAHLIELQTASLEKYVPGLTYDATAFETFFATKLLFKNQKFPVSFPTGSTVKIPENGLINNTHLFNRENKIKILFELLFLDTSFNLNVEIDYQRTDSDLFEMYQPFLSVQQTENIVEMLPSEYQFLRKDLNLTFDMSALMRVNAEVAFELIEPFLLKANYIRQMTIPRGELSLYISPYSTELPKLDEVNGSFKEIVIKIGITTPISALINYFEFKIKVVTDLVDIVKHNLPNTIWRSVEQISPLTIAAQKRFSNSVKLVDKTNASTYRNLLSPLELTTRMENELGVIVDRDIYVPKPQGSKEVMFGFTKNVEDEIVKTPSYAIYHTDEFSGNEFRPLTKTIYNHLKQYTADEVPQTSTPSFLNNPSEHPLQRRASSLVQNNDFLTTYASSSDYLEFESEEMSEKIIFNSWLNYHQKFYFYDSNIPISRMRKAAINGLEPPRNKVGMHNPLYDYYPATDGPINLETYSLRDESANDLRMYQRPVNISKKNDLILRRPVNTHGIPVVAQSQMPTHLPYLSDSAGGLFQTGSVAEIQQFLNGVPQINSPKILRSIGQTALNARMQPSVFLYQSPVDDYLDIRYINTSLINLQDLRASDAINQIVDIHQTNFSGNAAKKPYFVTRMSSSQPLPDKAFHMSRQWRDRFPDRYYFKHVLWDTPNYVLDDPSLFIPRRDWQSGRINMYAITNQDQGLHQYLFKGHNPMYREAVDIIDERWANSFFNTPNQVHQSALIRRASQVQPTNTATLAQQYANSWETRHAPTIQTVNHDVKPSSLVLNGRKLQPADAKTRYLKGKLPPIDKPISGNLVNPAGDNIATSIGQQTTNIRAKISQSAISGKSIDLTHAIAFERDQIRASSAKSTSDYPYDEPTQSSFWSSSSNSTCGRTAGSRCVNAASQNIKNNRIQLKPHQISVGLSKGWRNYVTKVLGMVGGLTAIGSLFIKLFSKGVLFPKDNSDHFESKYDNKDFTLANGVVKTNRHQISAFIVERNASGQIIAIEEVQKFSLNINTDVADYNEEGRPKNFSKPMEFLVNQLVNETEISADFMRKKVPANLSTTPEPFKSNSSMLGGSWLGYLQMFPLTQGIETIEITWEVLNS